MPGAPSELQIKGLRGSLAVLRSKLNQLLMLTSPAPKKLAAERLAVGREVVKFETSHDQDKLFVLSAA